MTAGSDELPPRRIDRNGIEVLDRDECLSLLGTGRVGRVAVSLGALPTILPVNYRLVGDTVLFRTGVGTKLDAATRGAVVAFEVDEIDPASHTGWSVVVTGVARETHPDAWSAPFLPEALPRWAPNGGETHVLSVRTDVVSGRRLC